MKSRTSKGKISTRLFLEEKDSYRGDPYAKYVNYGGWDPKRQEFTPLQFASLAVEGDDVGSSTNYALDCIALSYEAGFFTDTESFLKHAFATPRDLLVFCEQLHDYGFWLNERHFYAFLNLLKWDESEMRTYAEVADALEQVFENP